MAVVDFATLNYKSVCATPQAMSSFLEKVNATLRNSDTAAPSKYAALRQVQLGGMAFEYPRFLMVAQTQSDNWDILDLEAADAQVLVNAIEELRTLAPEADLREAIIGFEHLPQTTFVRERRAQLAESSVSTQVGMPGDPAADEGQKRRLISEMRAASAPRVQIRTEVQR